MFVNWFPFKPRFNFRKIKMSIKIRLWDSFGTLQHLQCSMNFERIECDAECGWIEIIRNNHTSNNIQYAHTTKKKEFNSIVNNGENWNSIENLFPENVQIKCEMDENGLWQLCYSWNFGIFGNWLTNLPNIEFQILGTKSVILKLFTIKQFPNAVESIMKILNELLLLQLLDIDHVRLILQWF